MSSNKIARKNVEENITKKGAANALERGDLGETEVLGGLENISSTRLLVFPPKINLVTSADNEALARNKGANPFDFILSSYSHVRLTSLPPLDVNNGRLPSERGAASLCLGN